MQNKQKNVLIAVDGSDNSERAIKRAKEYSDIINGNITLLTVLKPLSAEEYIYREIPESDENQLSDNVARSILEESLVLLDKPEDDVTMKIRKGSPADEILKEAEENKYDLVIMGSRGLGIFSRSFLGSVSDRVLNHIDTDTLIIK